MTDAVIPLEQLSATIVRDLLRAGLRAAVAAPLNPLKDPKAAARLAAAGCDFIMSAFPDRNAFYPLVVLGEAGNSLARIDTRAAIQSGPYDVSVIVRAENQTHLYTIRDAVKRYFLDNFIAHHQAGFSETELVSDTDASWDSTSKVLEWKLVYRGLVHVI